MVTYGEGKPCQLQGDQHIRAIRPLVDTRLILRAIVGLDRWSSSTKPGLQMNCRTNNTRMGVICSSSYDLHFMCAFCEENKKPPFYGWFIISSAFLGNRDYLEAVLTIAVNAAGSLTASSASTLRSSSIFAAFRPAINLP